MFNPRVLREDRHHLRNLIAEARADVVDSTGGVLYDVVQQPHELRELMGAALAQDGRDRMGVGKALSRRDSDVPVGVEQEPDGLCPHRTGLTN